MASNTFNSRSNDQRNKKPCVVPWPGITDRATAWPGPGAAPPALELNVIVHKNGVPLQTFVTTTIWFQVQNAWIANFQLADDTWWQTQHTTTPTQLLLQGRQAPTYEDLQSASLTAPTNTEYNVHTSRAQATFNYTVGPDLYTSLVKSRVPRQLASNLPPHTKGAD